MGEWVNYALKKGTLLDSRYRILEMLGIGGFGITYKAVNEKIDRQVAVKELFIRECITRDGSSGTEVVFASEKEKELFAEAKKRFLKEARAVRDFSMEPGVVHVLDYFEENETAYLVMEYLEGISLEQYFKEKGQMDAKTLFRLFWPLMETLDKIHKSGIIHRDISPDNIRISKDEHGTLRADLLDFGSARDYMIQKTHTVELKNGYAPLEQYSGDGTQGPWTDVYALCAVVYEGMTGQRPVNAVLRSMQDGLVMPSMLGIASGNGQEKIEKILKKGLALYPKDRYQSIKDMQEELSLLIFPPKEEKKKSKKAGIFAAGAILTLTALGAGIWWYYQSHLAWFLFHGEPTETFLLVAPSDIDLKSYEHSVQTIKDRLDTVLGEKSYLLKKKKDDLELILPLSVFPGKDFQEERTDLMNRYILAPNHLQISMNKSEWQDGDSPKDILRKASLKRSDIRNVEKKTGHIEGLESTKDTYLEITLTEEAGQRLKGQLQTEYKKEYRYMELNPDLENGGESLGYLYTDPDGDWTTFYQSLPEETYENGWQAVWNTDELAEGFSFGAEIPAEWEEQSVVWGDYQRKVGELGKDTVTIAYRTTDGAEEYAGKLAEKMISVKDSLDLLEIPYAMGMVPDESGDFVIRTAQKDMNQFLANLLTGYSFEVKAGDASYTVSSFDVEENADGTCDLACTLIDDYDYDKEAKNAWLKQYALPGQTITLLLNGCPLSSLTLKERVTDGILRFHTCLWNESGTFGEEERKLFTVCSGQSAFYTAGYDLEVQYSRKGQKVAFIKEQRKSDQPDMEKAKPYLEKMKAIREGITLAGTTSSLGEILDVNLALDLQKGYSKEAADAIGQILDLFWEMPEEYYAVRIGLNSTHSTQRVYFQRKKSSSKNISSLSYFRTDPEDEKQQNLSHLLTDSSFLKNHHIGEVEHYVAWGERIFLE